MPHELARPDPSILREYDIRGIVGRTLDADVAYALGRAFGTMVVRAGDRRAVVGRDGRPSSRRLSDAFIAGLAGSGAGVVAISCGPTPMLQFALRHLDIGAGAMVTGSHNPPDHNGFKLLLGRAPLTAEAIAGLGALVAAGDLTRGDGDVSRAEVASAYVDLLAHAIGDLPRLAVAWDPGHGATADIVRALVTRLPGRHVLLNATLDGTFPAHHPDPAVPKNLVQLQGAVVAHGCDLGFAFDGDGDRLGVVDGTGAILWPDQVLLLLGRRLLSRAPGAVIVSDVKASQVLFDGLAAAGGRPVMAPSGYTILRRRMVELGAPLAGEMSGHIFFQDRWHGVDDAIYAALRVLEALAASGASLAAFRASLPPVCNTPEIRIACADERKRGVVAMVAARLRAAGADVLAVDGVRVRERGGWWLLRASNTEPALVVRCEAPDQATLGALLDSVLDRLRACGVEPPPAPSAAPGAADDLRQPRAGILDQA